MPTDKEHILDNTFVTLRQARGVNVLLFSFGLVFGTFFGVTLTRMVQEFF